jgi:hypothetical protein
VSTLLHATVYVFLHNLLNVLVQIANKMGLQKKNTQYVQARKDTLTVTRGQVCESGRPSLWSSEQSSSLQIQGPGFDSRHYQTTQPREYN